MSGRLVHEQDWEAAARRANFRPSNLAALCSVSLRQLERHFAKRFRQTPGNFSRRLRIQLARDLISRGWSTKAAAAELGYTDSAHLCREFRKQRGMVAVSMASAICAAGQ